MIKPFALPGTKTHFAPDRPFSLEHIRLELRPDLARQTLTGRAVLTLRCRRDGANACQLDAVDLVFSLIRVGDRPAETHYDGKILRVELGQAVPRNESLTLTIDYTCSPTRGLYFVGPDEAHPDRARECWTQGQDEDSRHYIPCLDTPLVKTTSEILCTVDSGLTVLSNGDLIAKRDVGDGKTTWHYRLDVPHSPYLITLACGPFCEVRDRAPETGVDVYFYGPLDRQEDLHRSLGRTGAMIDYFSQQIGVAYPFSRYSQIFVSDFIFGGMENTTATTLTGEALLDARAALDHDIDSLVAHELAHQWWGDLITCREWPEAWLNEGFATYFEYVWKEHAQGRDEADVDLLADLDAYLDEAGAYQRPIVCRQFEEPIDLFDRHLYEKGGRVLHMLRQNLGEEVFWRTLHTYASRFARGSVETRDLARVVEEVSGRNLDRFFHQWVENPGHPDLSVAWQWDADKKEGTLRVEQKQTGDTVYEFDLPVRFEVAGQQHDDSVQVTQKSHAFLFRLAHAPTQVVLDPGDTLLKSCTFDKARPLWQRQLTSARLGVDRVLAARALGEKPEAESVASLRVALESDPFWAVRSAAATALGRSRRQDALDALLAATTQDHPRVRRAVVAALGEFRVDLHPGNQRAAERLATMLGNGDASYFVEAAAALALGRTRAENAPAALASAMARPSYQDLIRARAVDGLGASANPDAFALVEKALAPSFSFQARRAAVAAIATLGEGTPNARRAREHLEAALLDKDFRVRMDAALALSTLGDPRALPAIDRATAAELDGRTKRRMRQSAMALREKGTAGEAMHKLSDEIEKLRNEATQLRERLEKLESSRAPKPTEPSAKGGAGKRPRPGVHRNQRGAAPTKRIRK